MSLWDRLTSWLTYRGHLTERIERSGDELQGYTSAFDRFRGLGNGYTTLNWVSRPDPPGLPSMGRAPLTNPSLQEFPVSHKIK